MTFPIVDAFLVRPEEGKTGKIGICTNTLAPTMVINEIPFELRKDVAALGSLVVSRDGAERMIVNCLCHPTIEYLLLFGEETLSFRPSTNLLLALMDGFKEGNVIAGGRGVSHMYPSIKPEIFEVFKKRIKVLPLYRHVRCQDVIERYMEWLKPQIPSEVFNCLVKIQGKKKVYYDSLRELTELITKTSASSVQHMDLDPKDFQHLQPPIIEIDTETEKNTVPFEVKQQGNDILLNIDVDNKLYSMVGQDSFLMAYSLLGFANKLTPIQQLLLGAELSRVEVKIKNNVTSESFVNSQCKEGERTTIPIAARTLLKPDEKYYYKIGVKNGKISVQSLAHDVCVSVFELRGKHLLPVLQKLADENRFDDYEQALLHRVDVGIETGRAAIALSNNQEFFQDFRNLFSENTTEFPLLMTEADSFLTNHKNIITKLYTTGLTMGHPDAHKGMMRSACVLAVYRRSGESLENFPAIYASGSQSTGEMRRLYKDQLLSSDNQGTYTYGSRTRDHFGMDQLTKAVDALQKNPIKPYVIQRFDFAKDMTLTPRTDASGNETFDATHDPCLTHDIYFISNNKLHSFHIARAHNMVNAYPENIFGLHDAYDSFIAEKLGIEMGDMFMLSSRGNMLLLTEEQKAKKLIAEPSKPVGELDASIGPTNMVVSVPSRGVGYATLPLQEQDQTDHPCLSMLENYNGQNILEKAALYLKNRGNAHNNPIIGCFDPQKPSDDQRLVYFQCNVRGGKLHATAVFLNGTLETFSRDTEICNYLATQYSKTMEKPLGNLFLFYAPIGGK